MKSGCRARAPGDADPLALAAGELVRIAVGVAAVESHQLQELPHPLFSAAPGQLMDLQRFGQDLSRRHPGVQRGVRILKNHLHPAAHAPQGPAFEFGQLHAVQENPACSGTLQLQDGPPGAGLAATALSHQPQCLSFTNEERDAVDGAHRTHLAPEQDAPVHWIVLLESFHPHQLRRVRDSQPAPPANSSFRQQDTQ